MSKEALQPSIALPLVIFINISSWEAFELMYMLHQIVTCLMCHGHGFMEPYPGNDYGSTYAGRGARWLWMIPSEPENWRSTICREGTRSCYVWGSCQRNMPWPGTDSHWILPYLHCLSVLIRYGSRTVVLNHFEATFIVCRYDASHESMHQHSHLGKSSLMIVLSPRTGSSWALVAPQQQSLWKIYSKSISHVLCVVAIKSPSTAATPISLVENRF